MAENQQTDLAQRPQQPSQLFTTFGESFGVNPGQVMRLLAATVISVGKGEPAPTAEEISACAIVCNVHNLNPFTKEIHCFRSKGKMLFAIGIDGWSKIAQRQPQMNGVEWEAHLDKDGNFYAMTCKIYRKDWALPVVVTEYLAECKRDTDPWNKSPRRMMRNRSYSQAVRMAFAIGGLLDETEADQITEGRFSSAVLEGAESLSQDEMEIRELATKLNYNDAKLRTIKQQYADRPQSLLDFLRSEAGQKRPSPAILQSPSRRTNKPSAQAQQKQQPVEPEDESQAMPSDDPPQSEGFAFELNSQALPTNSGEDDGIGDGNF